MRTTHKLFLAGLAAAGALLGSQAQAHDDVRWSVTVGAPGVVVPAPVYGLPAPVVGVPVYRAPAPVYGEYRGERHDRGDRYDRHEREPHWREGRDYRQPTRWDRDGDGIPNRYDRVYNPRWDRDGDGIPNRRDRRPDNPRW